MMDDFDITDDFDMMENFEETILEAVQNLKEEINELGEMKEAWRQQMEQFKMKQDFLMKKNETKDRIIGGLSLVSIIAIPLMIKNLIITYPGYSVALSVTCSIGFWIYKTLR